MTLSKNAFRLRLILARKLPHEQIVDQDKRLVWTSLQLQSLIFPVLVGLYLIFYFFRLVLFLSWFISVWHYRILFSCWFLVRWTPSAILFFILFCRTSLDLSFRHLLPDTICSLYFFLLTSHLGVTFSLLVIFFFPSWKNKITWWVWNYEWFFLAKLRQRQREIENSVQSFFGVDKMLFFFCEIGGGAKF